MEESRRESRRNTVHRCRHEVRDEGKKYDRREKGRKVDEQEHLKRYGGLTEGIGMKASLRGPMNTAKKSIL